MKQTMKTLLKNATMIVALLTMTSLSARADEAKNDTPKATLENMAKAMAAGDADTFASCFDATKEEAKVLRAMGDYVSTAAKFQKAMIGAYGQEAVKDEEKGLQKMLDGNLLENVQIKIDGDKAVATMEGEDKPLNLIKKDGSWKIVPASMLADLVKLGDTPADLNNAVEEAVKMFQAMADAQRKVIPLIGKEGKTAEDIQNEIGQAMMKAMLENMPDAGAE
jgi:hypothetical protein